MENNFLWQVIFKNLERLLMQDNTIASEYIVQIRLQTNWSKSSSWMETFFGTMKNNAIIIDQLTYANQDKHLFILFYFRNTPLKDVVNGFLFVFN